MQRRFTSALSTKLSSTAWGLARAGHVSLCATAHMQKAFAHDSPPDLKHFRTTNTEHPLYQKPERLQKKEWDNPIKNRIWSEEEVNAVKEVHTPPKDMVDKIAYAGVKLLRFGFDIVSGYKFGSLTEQKILRRILFLETAAGIPGMVAGSIRHLRSLRLMKRDHGWIHTLLEEAENERMHMLVFMDTYRPGIVFRSAVIVTQGLFWNVFFFTYLVSPRLCHRFVGYLEEEATRTYSVILRHMDSTDPKDAPINAFAKRPANTISKKYWHLPETATLRDVILAVRADEANHRDVNHTFAGLEKDDVNPFVDEGKKKD